MLTNQTIIEMVRSKVDRGVIINAINARPGRYSLGPNSLIQLSGAGVPAEVIEAMQAQSGAVLGTTSNSTSQPKVQATSAWVSSISTNKFDDTKTVQASRVFAENSGAFLRVDAECQKNPLPSNIFTGISEPFSLRLYFRYIPAPGSHADFSQNANPVSLKVSPDAFTDNATITQQGGGTFVEMRVSVDGTKRLDQQASSSGTPITAAFSFRALFGIGMSSADAMAATEIQIDMPLNNGDAATVKIEPHEASFREFASNCMAAFPPPKPPSPRVLAKEYASEGNRYLGSNDYDNAIKSYAAALTIDRNNYNARENLSSACNFRPASMARRPQKTDDPCAASVFGGPFFYLDKTRMWMRQDNRKDVDFQQANQYCQDLRAGGFSDWKLPKVEELQLLVDDDHSRGMAPSDSALSLDEKPGTRTYPAGYRWDYKSDLGVFLTGPAFWTLSPGRSPDHQMTFLQFVGSPNSERVTSAKLGLRALCTRDANKETQGNLLKSGTSTNPAPAAPLSPANPNIKPSAQPDGFVPRRSDNAAQRTYSGPLGGFHDALMNVIYASFNKEDIAPYRKDIFAINNYAHNCATLTPAVAAEINTEGTGHSTQPSTADHLASKYGICFSGSSAHQDEVFSADTGRPWNKTDATADLRQILVDISSPENLTGASETPSQTHTFVVRVWATRLWYDPPLPKSSATGIRSELWPVMEATITP